MRKMRKLTENSKSDFEDTYETLDSQSSDSCAQQVEKRNKTKNQKRNELKNKLISTRLGDDKIQEMSYSDNH